MEELTQAEAFVRAASPWLVHITEAVAVLVVSYGVLRAFVGFAASLLRSPAGDVPRTRTRLALGRSLALALEFLLAADILQTLLTPTVQQVGILAAIAVIRTGLNYFLGKEMEQESREVREPGTSPTVFRPIAAGSISRNGETQSVPKEVTDGR